MGQDFKAALSVPAFWFGVTGLIPFIALPVFGFFSVLPPAFWLGALHIYGALILSFMGGVIWGTALVGGGGFALLLWSMVPMLVAWLSFFLGGLWVFLCLVIGFLIHMGLERVGPDRPSWYRAMRLVLMPVVFTSLLFGLFAYW